MAAQWPFYRERKGESGQWLGDFDAVNSMRRGSGVLGLGRARVGSAGSALVAELWARDGAWA
ncbi:hypothetical protein E2562_005653 [Oryza meyeriana var. granulata]|uniref:Uncharacterized protein n=1 Tax=Oryza meyeriana var. granulata TaxID=110450 RepID=A0A6G1BJ47_9ORYZ|nr:hypothetical protein E2562_005653 [Oryza meyeriana var. granulata]